MSADDLAMMVAFYLEDRAQEASLLAVVISGEGWFLI